MKSLVVVIIFTGMNLSFSAAIQAEEQVTFTAAQLEHFEKQIRPLLVEHCYSCHQGEKHKGGLRLDSRAGVLKGGDSGPSAVVGKPAESELIKAVNYDADGYQMPPKGKLSAEQISHLTTWVQDGLPWPTETGASATGVDPEAAWKKRQEHWSLQPLKKSINIPDVKGSTHSWAKQPIDHFIHDKLLAHQLAPAASASKSVLIRRLKYDLLGLPPTPEEITEFEQDNSPDAYEKLVDRYLSSPHYGERYGRHWLDLMRYAESLGHEFDFTIDEIWRYRDYVIRAFNEDLPYNQLVIEHLAGDMLKQPRINQVTQLNESVLGTGFLWMSQGKHSPVDIKAEECDLIDNQIDVMTKTFLASSVACARCHDHKFDAITANDYYALSGYLKSSCRDYVDLNSQEVAQDIAKLMRLKFELLKRNLQQDGAVIVNQEQLPPTEFLDRMLTELSSGNHDIPKHKANHPLQVYAELKALVGKVSYEQAAKKMLEKYQKLPATSCVLEKLSEIGQTTGYAFHRHHAQLVAHEGQGFEFIGVSTLHSSSVPQLTGTARTPTFKIEQPFLFIKANRKTGKSYLQEPRFNKLLKTGQIHLVIEGFQHIMSPIYSGLTINVKDAPESEWYKVDVSKWVGSRVYVEIEDMDDGWVRVDEIRASAQGDNPITYNPRIYKILQEPTVNSLSAFSEKLCTEFKLTWDRFLQGQDLSTAEIEFLNVILRLKTTQLKIDELETKVIVNQENTSAEITKLINQRLTEVKAPVFGVTTTELSPWDDVLLVRGNPNKPGKVEPRRFLSAFANQLSIEPAVSNSSFLESQSRRHELALKMTHPDNPLFARVIVNRIWKHHFGQGLVTTVDDFGHMGNTPTHPELLDYLANWFIQHDYSIKELSRMLVTSSTFMQSSDRSESGQELDPQNLLYHRMNLRRLEAEVLRDALIYVTNDLNPELYGASIPVHLTPHMQGRGRPSQSGPLEGNYRRSIYTSVRRNFLNPFFLAFDYPLPMTTTGRRSVSNVPAQSLAMKNNPLVHMQATHLAKLMLQDDQTEAQRLQNLFLRLFARNPTDTEQQILADFIRQSKANPQTTWENVCHLLLNMKEFIYIP